MIFISPTQVKLFRLCQRKWAYAYIEKKKAPTTAKQQFGTDVHSRLERWLKAGEPPGDDEIGRIAKQGIRAGWLPTPSNKLRIEDKFELILKGPLDGIILTGFIDCCAPPGYEGMTEPLVIDHKTTSDLKWAMKSDELSEDPQGVIYALRAMARYEVTRARARWVYYAASSPMQGPRKPKGGRAVEWLFDATTALWKRTFDALQDDLAAMRQAHTAWPTAQHAPPTLQACGVYGGCPYAGLCNIAPEDALATAILQDGREHYGLRLTPQCGINSAPDNAAAPHSAPPTTGEESAMNLIDKLKQMKAEAEAAEAAPAPAPQPVAEAPTVAPDEPVNAPPATVAEDERTTLLDRLRAMGDAEAVNPAPAAAAEPAPEPPAEPAPAAAEQPIEDGLDKMLKGELVERMKATGTPVPASWTRARIIAWLREHPEGDPATATADKSEVTVQDCQEPAKSPEVVVKATDPEGAKARAEAAAGDIELETEDGESGPIERAAAEVPVTTNTVTAEPATAPSNGAGFVLMLDAVYAKNTTIANGVHRLEDLAKPIADMVAKDNGVEHWGLVEFHRGGPMLAAKFERMMDAHGLNGVVIADSKTAECKALREVLIRRAGVVVQGIA